MTIQLLRFAALTAFLHFPLLASGQAAPAVSSGNDGGKTLAIPRLGAEDMRIDGVLDEAEWGQAARIDDFHQFQPVEYGTPTQRTEVSIFYTEDALYIAARLWDTNPELIAANVLRQGQALGPDDTFTVVLDPYLDRRNGYRFEMNANGVRVEGLYQNVTEIEDSWDGIWQSGASRDGEGWTGEIRIPFQSISFGTDVNAWGINFQRSVKRNTESIAWVSRNRQVNPGIAGTITGLEGMRQGRGLDIVPSAVARTERRFATDVSRQSLEPQLDIYYKLTSELNASLTLNTDFSSTEVDNRQVNLTRFSLFFPEKREFFIRDSDIFEFGQIGLGAQQGAVGNSSYPAPSAQNARPFFSRRIGLSPNGAPIDLNAGAKLSGRVGDWNVGALMINQGEDELTGNDSANIFVGRAALNVLAESQVGVIATSGDPQSNTDNHLIGTDFRYRNSRLQNGKAAEVSGFYQQTETPGKAGDDASYGMVLSYPNNQGWLGSYRYKRVEKNFDPAVGYVNQTDIQDHALDVAYTHFLRPGGFMRLVTGFFDTYKSYSLEDGGYITDVKTLRFSWTSNTGDLFYGRAIRNNEMLRQNFTIYRPSDGSRPVVIPGGEYQFDEKILGIITGSQRVYSGRIDARWGEYFDGERLQWFLTGNWRPNRYFQFGAQYTENHIKLPYGNFRTQLVALTGQMSFTPSLAWSNLIQYDNVSETIGLNSRLHWIPEAGRQAFLVLNYGLEDFDKDEIFESTNADLSLKFSYTIRY